MHDLRRDVDPHAARPDASPRRLLIVLLCVVTAAAAILSWWWWTHRSYATGLGGRVVRLREHELVALYGPPTSRGLIPASLCGLGLDFVEDNHAKMFGPVLDPLALSLYWRLPNDGHRHVWLGRTWHGPWMAFDGYEYRGSRF